MVFPHTKIILGTWWSTPVIYNLVKKTLVLVKHGPKEYMVNIYHYIWALLGPFEKTYHIAPYLDRFRTYIMPQ